MSESSVDLTNQWVLLWSQKQNALHVETLPETLAINRRACMQNKPGDYRVLMVGSHEDVSATSRSFARMLEQRRSAARA